jgi:hypothetical protein
VEEILGNRLAGVVEERVGIGAEEVFDIVDHGAFSS